MQLTIEATSKKLKSTQYGEKMAIGLKTKEYEDKWLNGWEDLTNAKWAKGDVVEATVTENKGFLNFKAIQGSVKPDSISSSEQASQGANFDKKVPLGGKQEQEEKPNWNEINFGKCKHQFLVEAYKCFLPKGTSSLNLNSVEREAEEWAEMSMRILPKKEVSPHAETMRGAMNDTVGGVVAGGEDINIQDIPFG